MERNENLAELVKAASGMNAGSNLQELERRVMIDVTRRSIVRSRRKARLGLIASLSGLAMLLGASIAVLVVWFPSRYLAWIENIKLPKIDTGILESVTKALDSVPQADHWGGWVIVTLVATGIVGFVYYLNTLFSENL